MSREISGLPLPLDEVDVEPTSVDVAQEAPGMPVAPLALHGSIFESGSDSRKPVKQHARDGVIVCGTTAA
jgi:hypothetical protein